MIDEAEELSGGLARGFGRAGQNEGRDGCWRRGGANRGEMGGAWIGGGGDEVGEWGDGGELGEAGEGGGFGLSCDGGGAELGDVGQCREIGAGARGIDPGGEVCGGDGVVLTDGEQGEGWAEEGGEEGVVVEAVEGAGIGEGGGGSWDGVDDGLCGGDHGGRYDPMGRKSAGFAGCSRDGVRRRSPCGAIEL